MSETGKKYLENLLGQAVNSLGFSVSEIQISTPEEKFGDYATNVALVLAKQAKKNPQEVASQLVSKLNEIDVSKVFNEISSVGGFINFKLSAETLLHNLLEIHKTKNIYGSSQIGKGQKILVEYFQPNIAKPLHLGHLRTAIIGDSLFRLFKFSGFNPESDTHLGDWGTQFGLLLFSFKKYGNIGIVEKNPIDELNKLYVKINTEAETDPGVRELGKAEFVKLEAGDKENRDLWKKFKDWSWQEFEIIYKDLGVRRADHDWPESFFEDKMPAILVQLKSKGLLKESQGAQIVNLEEYNLGVAVLIKSDGGTTYLLRDLATLIFRKSQGFVKQYYVVDVRQSHTLKQTFKIVELMGEIILKEAVHVAYGFLTLPEGAMSTRKGTVVGAKEFIASVQQDALEIIKEKNPGLAEKESISQVVASGAIKYFDLSHNMKSDIVFDPKKAISFEGNTGPYLQYTHARIHGILRKVKDLGLKITVEQEFNFTHYKDEEMAVMRKLHQFPEIVEYATVELLPNVIANYLFELSHTFNGFYQAVPVIQETNEQLKSFRISLIIATAQVIKNGLNLLGIEAPEEM